MIIERYFKKKNVLRRYYLSYDTSHDKEETTNDNSENIVRVFLQKKFLKKNRTISLGVFPYFQIFEQPYNIIGSSCQDWIKALGSRTRGSVRKFCSLVFLKFRSMLSCEILQSKASGNQLSSEIKELSCEISGFGGGIKNYHARFLGYPASFLIYLARNITIQTLEGY